MYEFGSIVEVGFGVEVGLFSFGVENGSLSFANNVTSRKILGINENKQKVLLYFLHKFFHKWRYQN